MAGVDLIRNALVRAVRAVRAAGALLGSWLSDASYLQRWLVLGAALGVVAGLGAILFYSALALGTHLLLGTLAGYTPPAPAGEGGTPGSSGFIRPWAIPLVTTLGGLISGSLVFLLAPEAEGHGTDAAIEAVHSNPRGIRIRAVLIKIVASAVTIGSGGSGGREGPTAQISAGFGSFLARFLDLDPEDGRIAVSVGIGSGIGAIFGAPLGGAVLAADLIYRDDFEVAALIPGLVASIVAYTVFGLVENFNPLFGYVGRTYQFTDPLRLVWYGVIGVVAGVVGLGYAKSFYGTAALFGRIRLPRALKPAIGGLLVGLLALVVPEVLGTGYGWVQQALGDNLRLIPLWVVLLLPPLRILATSLSIGSGGSGGIFGPGMVIGAFTGAAIWRLLEPIAPAVPHHPAPFVVAGMMACFGAIARAPLAVMIMVAEMTGSLEVLAPAMVAVGIAYLIVRRNDDTIYRSQLRNRAESPAHRILAGLPLLSVTSVQHAMARPRVVAASRDTVATVSQSLDDSRVAGAPVTDDEGRYVGVVTRANLDSYAPETVIAEVPVTSVPPLRDQSHLDQALDTLITSATSWLPVIDEDRRLVGTLSISDLVRGYRIALQSTVRRMTIVTSDGQREVVVAPGSPLDGEPIRGDVPHGVLITSIERGPDIIQPTGDTIIHAGDRLSSLGSAASLDLLQAAASTSADGAAPHAGP